MLVSYHKYNYKLNYNITNLVKWCLIGYKCQITLHALYILLVVYATISYTLLLYPH